MLHWIQALCFNNVIFLKRVLGAWRVASTEVIPVAQKKLAATLWASSCMEKQ